MILDNYRGTWEDEDTSELRKLTREFIANEITPHQERFAQQHRVDRDVWRKAGQAGLLCISVPEEYGGGGGDFRHEAVVLHEQGLAFDDAWGYSVHSSICAHYILEYGTEEQKKAWLPKLASGEYVAAIAMTEPGTGSDLQSIRTKAVRDGDEWVINGSKTFITNGYNADLVIVAARTSPEKKSKGITLFAVETGMEGFERGRKLDKVGQHESDTAELFFENVRVPSTNIIGEIDRGFIHMMEMLPQERVGAAVSNIAHAAPILEETLQYAKDRKAFGQPIGSLQWNKFLLADLVTRIEVTQAYVDNCVAAHAAGELTAIDAAKAKWWTAQVQNEVLDHCVQLHGGYGFMTEYRAARAWMDARVTKIWAGSNEIMKELIGRDLGL